MFACSRTRPLCPLLASRIQRSDASSRRSTLAGQTADQSQQPHPQRLARIRNIGILAHIDAGKTTTTERLLYYAGRTEQLGEVHHGTTVTDFLAQERERGITICSAAVCFDWRDHRVNLLDTPGHIDFTMEVEQSLAAIDGAIVILDGSAGVEVQTLTVWSQADRQRLPRLVFVNKMDRPDADFAAAVGEVRTKLSAVPLPLQWPVRAANGSIAAIVDPIRLQRMEFSGGRSLRCVPLSGDALRSARDQREQLVDQLSGYDDRLADEIIGSDCGLADISAERIVAAIRRATLAERIVPVLCGSAYKNCGVQPLCDAILAYLPQPDDRNAAFDCFGRDFAGKVFKVVHDRQRGGALSFVRMMRGRLRRGAKVVTSSGVAEQVQRLYEPLADEYREVQQADEGDVVIVAGLKSACTGDLLVSSMSALRAAQQRLDKAQKRDGAPAAVLPATDDRSEQSDELDADRLDDVTIALGLRLRVPDAVYFCSIEPPSQSKQLALDTALRQLQREDPSLRVRYDEHTAQTVLGGMGELHLDIVRSRLLTEYRIDAELGPLQIAYRETLSESSARETLTIEKEIAGSKQSIVLEMSLVPRDDEAAEQPVFRLDTTPEAVQRLQLVWARHIATVRKGAVAALERGPRLGGQVCEVQIVLHDVRIGRGTAESFVTAAAAQCVHRCLLAAETRLLEPIMRLRIVLTGDGRTSAVLADLSRRRATVLDVTGGRGAQTKVIDVLAPLAELAGYSSALRIMCSGAASMSMQPHRYARMSGQDEALAIRRAQGLE